MDEFLKLSKNEQALWITQAASIKDLNPIIIEKDFWVCWVLKEIFTIDEIKDYVVFKGGTSLSKVYKAIERFSEDLDLTISKEYFGLEADLSIKSVKQRDKYLKELQTTFADKLKNEILPLLRLRFSKSLEKAGISANFWSLQITEDEEEAILFQYPKILGEKSIATNYIKPVVKLEFGIRGEGEPNQLEYIDTYMAEATGGFHVPRIAIKTLKAERTFWEKATILHMYHHWPKGKVVKSSMSRHYYDLFKLYSHETIGESSIGNQQLLSKVAEHKTLYFPSGWASYATARIGQIRLMPPEHLLPTLRKDYKDMTEMFFAEAPSFERLMKEMKILEQKINDYKQIL